MLSNEEKEEILNIKAPREATVSYSFDKTDKILAWAIDYALPALFRNVEHHDKESIQTALDNLP
jgi:hypothetical protein